MMDNRNHATMDVINKWLQCSNCKCQKTGRVLVAVLDDQVVATWRETYNVGQAELASVNGLPSEVDGETTYARQPGMEYVVERMR